MRKFASLLLLTIAAAAGCAPAGDSSADLGTGLAPSGGTMAISATIPAGSELYRCQFFEVSATDTNLIHAVSTMTAGSHHLVLYQTGLTQVPRVGPFDCQASDYMEDISGIVYAAQSEQSEIALPDGVGLPIPAAEILFLQSHYLNATPDVIDAQIHIDLTLADDSAITTKAGTLFFYNFNIYVPAGGSSTATLQCPIPKDIQLVGAASHMHARGVNYVANVLNGANAPAPLYTTTEWSAPTPTVFAPPRLLSGGSVIQYSCDYNNPSANEFYTGFSAATDEMCMFVSFYFPALDYDTNFCLVNSLVGLAVGGGVADGTTTLGCLAGCTDDHCSARCVTESCPAVAPPMNQWRNCLASTCGTPCAKLGSDACNTCLQTSCATQATALEAAHCQ